MKSLAAALIGVCIFIGCESSVQTASETDNNKATANYETVPANEIAKIDAHKFKNDCVTEGSVSNFDIVWDKSEPTKDKRHVQCLKKNSSPPIYTDCHITWGEVLEQYPAG